MAERLTRKIGYEYEKAKRETQLLEINNKLGKLEDILEKYGIESFELLEHIIKKGKVINFIIEDFAKEEYDKMKYDRNTWKMACELACQIIISGYCDGMEDTTDWESAIYQWKEDNDIETYGIGVEELLGYLLEQAKMEGNNETKI